MWNTLKRLTRYEGKDFFLYVAFHDPHRCGHTHPQLGAFCQKFGDGQQGREKIPDWQPEYYSPDDVVVPYFVPDTPDTRKDLADQYTTISRLDQGIGLIVDALKSFGVYDDTLIVYSSDNGIPFPSGRTNFYDSGIRVPLIIRSPDHEHLRGQRIDCPVSLLDVMPTLLHWHQHDPAAMAEEKSLIALLDAPYRFENRAVFGSHSFHEVTMTYPMRYVRTFNYKLIHNINYRLAFPIDQDLYLSPTFQDILRRTVGNLSLPWYTTLKNYYFRLEWELFDLNMDPEETHNLAHMPVYANVFKRLRRMLHQWQNDTADAWLCSPHAVLQSQGQFFHTPTCMPLFDDLI